METVHTIAQVRERVAAARRAGKRIGFVPTMGYLHRGHTSLVEIAKRHTDYQVMSIFVNKIQFNDPKDYAAYPKDLERDAELARGAGVDLLFIPDDSEMYRDRLVFVDIDTLGANLCGANRPGHFRGVLTVVSKLFNIVLPDVSVFGQKDVQQAACIEKMVADLDFPLRIVVAPTVREADGLAMSSRNKHLTPAERQAAVAIHRGLRRAEALLQSGERRSAVITAAVEEEVRPATAGPIDYISIVRYADLQYTDRIEEKAVLAVAAFFGKPRLIDNMIIDVAGEEVRCVY